MVLDDSETLLQVNIKFFSDDVFREVEVVLLFFELNDPLLQ